MINKQCINYEYLDQELQIKLTCALDNNPLLMGDLMKFIGNYTAEYNDKLQKKRNAEAKSAVYDLLMCYRIPTKGIPKELLSYFIEPIRALFPNGYNHPHSIKSRNFLDEFVKAARRDGWTPTDNFIKDIRNFSDNLSILYNQFDSSVK